MVDIVQLNLALLHATTTFSDPRVKRICAQVQQLNGLINQYNHLKTEEEKIAKLEELYLKKQDIEDSFQIRKHQIKKKELIISPVDEELRRLHSIVQIDFFQALKQQYDQLGYPSIYQARKARGEISSPACQDEDLPQILTDMDPTRLNEFTSLLADPETFRITLQTHSVFKGLLKNYQFTFLGGGNSKNYVVTKISTGERYVLKSEDTLSFPNRIVRKMRQNPFLAHLLPPLSVGRQALVTSPEVNVTRILGITPLQDGPDLETLLEDDKKKGMSHKTQMALKIYPQMANILTAFGKARVAFPDMKNANWVINKKGELTLIDSKSLLRTNDQGIVDLKHIENLGYGHAYSYGYQPPEWVMGKPFNAEQAHVWLLGVNLYQALTGTDHDALMDRTELAEEEKKAVSFPFPRWPRPSPEEKALRNLVARATTPNLSERISLDEFTTSLNALRAQYYRPEGLKVFNKDFIKQYERLKKDAPETLKTIDVQLDTLNGLPTQEKDQLKQEIEKNFQSMIEIVNNKGVEHLKKQTSCMFLLNDIEKSAYRVNKDVVASYMSAEKQKVMNASIDELHALEAHYHDVTLSQRASEGGIHPSLRYLPSAIKALFNEVQKYPQGKERLQALE